MSFDVKSAHTIMSVAAISCLLSAASGSSRVEAQTVRCDYGTIARANSNGTLDETFNSDGGWLGVGTVNIDFAGGWDVGADAELVNLHMAIVVAGAHQSQFLVARYTATGDLDTSFGGGDGYATTTFPGATSQSAAGVAVDPDDYSLVVAGTASVGGRGVLAIARFTDAGVLDTSFGTGGRVLIDLPNQATQEIRDVTVTPEGIVVVGAADSATQANGYNLLIARVTSAGALDTTFNGTGYVLRSMTAYNDRLHAVRADGSGKIVAAGWASNRAVVVRYDVDGTADTTFDGDGARIVDFPGTSGEIFTDLIFDSSGRIVLGGRAYGSLGLARLNTNGSLDGTFGIGGMFNYDLPGERIEGLAWSAGKILAVTRTESGTERRSSVIRFNTDGTLDTTFAQGAGHGYAGFPGSYGTSVAVDFWGKIYVVTVNPVTGYSCN